jgi:hypothetical protein
MNGGVLMSRNNPKDWRELCRKAQEELDPDKLMDLIVEINKALDEHDKKQREIVDDVTDPDSGAEARQLEVSFSKRGPTWQNPLLQFCSLPLAGWPKSA